MCEWVREAVVHQQPNGVVVKVPSNRPAVWIDAAGGVHYLRKSESKQQFYWVLNGCCEGVQHYRLCTPDALKQPCQLLRPFCATVTGVWPSLGRRALPDAEQQFVVLLVRLQQSEEWCCQVKHKCCWGPFDFYNWQRDVYVQIDDDYHFRRGSIDKTFARHLVCNVAAVSHKIGLVRLHVGDLHRADTVLAAIHTASQHKCVVFSATYSSRGVQHVYALCAALGLQGLPTADIYGNIQIC